MWDKAAVCYVVIIPGCFLVDNTCALFQNMLCSHTKKPTPAFCDSFFFSGEKFIPKASDINSHLSRAVVWFIETKQQHVSPFKLGGNKVTINPPYNWRERRGFPGWGSACESFRLMCQSYPERNKVWMFGFLSRRAARWQSLMGGHVCEQHVKEKLL